jgi:hypothetical protein
MKNCTQCNQSFEIREEDRRFYEMVDMPDPEMCPDCRMQRRMMFRNFFNLYHRKCDLTGKQIISMYDVDVPFPVYEMHEWWSDKWSGMEYGMNINWDRPVFEQLKILYQKVPRMGIFNTHCENTDYCNMSWRSRNCYLVFGNVGNEDCYYGHIVWQSKNCFDCLYVYASEFCYQCADCVNCYGLVFSEGCDNCSNSKFLRNCLGCADCFGCAGLKNKSHYIFNKPYSKDEYTRKMKEFNSGSFTFITMAQKKIKELAGEETVKYYHGFNCENVTGDYLYNCKNIFNSYDLKNCENCAYSATLDRFTNCYDCNFSAPPNEWSYNSLTSTGHHLMMCHVSYDSADLFYCESCSACKNCFGCIGLKNKEYCIFNKQYSREEYEQNFRRIVQLMKKTGDWGQFFPPDFSPFAYNETIACEYYPLSKKDVELRGLSWKEKDENKNYKGPKYEIPDDIREVSDDICKQILICEKTGKIYRIIPQELKFYREQNLPVSRICPDERHKERMALRNPRRLFSRNCAKCGTGVQTTYAPDRPETVYCEKCYLKEVY